MNIRLKRERILFLAAILLLVLSACAASGPGDDGTAGEDLTHEEDATSALPASEASSDGTGAQAKSANFWLS